MKLFKVPITHEYIQNLTEFDLEFIEMSTALDDPKLRQKILYTVYDEDYDEFEKETAEDELTPEEKKMMEEIINKQSGNTVEDDGFVPMDNDTTTIDDPNDWEEVE